MDVLLTWVGSRDPIWDNPRTKQRQQGPILSLLQSRSFDRVYLFFNLSSTSDDFRRRANTILRACTTAFPRMEVHHRPIDLVSVTDFREIYRVVNHECQTILTEAPSQGQHYFVYLSPGTPQMQTVWVLLVQAGLLPARMIEATSPDLLAPGAPLWHEVDLSLPDFPQIVSPGETARVVGVLDAQNANLVSENQRLAAEIALLRTGSNLSATGPIPEDFRLSDYLVAQERALYLRAFEQANRRGAPAARLLGVEPATFRARASTFGIHRRMYSAVRKMLLANLSASPSFRQSGIFLLIA